MERADGYTIASREELERTGHWSLVRRSVDCRSFGVNLVEIPPGESIPEHDETERDQEELFYVISGRPTLVIDAKIIRPLRVRSRGQTRHAAGPCETTIPCPRRC